MHAFKQFSCGLATVKHGNRKHSGYDFYIFSGKCDRQNEANQPCYRSGPQVHGNYEIGLYNGSIYNKPAKSKYTYVFAFDVHY